jgi:YHS domain-containing protein
MIHVKNLIVVACLLILTAGHATAQATGVRQKQFNLENGLALEGYDPVAYFTTSTAVKGKRDITALHNGITYRFTSIQNRDKFNTAPDKYEPQYGGWCAYAMGAKGEKVEIDPETFKIVDGKLYLFYNKFFNNTLESWNKDETRLKTNADQSWAKFIR